MIFNNMTPVVVYFILHTFNTSTQVGTVKLEQICRTFTALYRNGVFENTKEILFSKKFLEDGIFKLVHKDEYCDAETIYELDYTLNYTSASHPDLNPLYDLSNITEINFHV